MWNIVFIGMACVLLPACDVYHPAIGERVHVGDGSQGDGVQGTIVLTDRLVPRRLPNAWSGSTTATAKDEGDRVHEAQAAQEAFRGGNPVSPEHKEVTAGGASGPGAGSEATGSKLTPIEAAQEAFRGAPVSPGDEVASEPGARSGATGSKLTPIEAAQEAFRSLPVSPKDEVTAGGASGPAARSEATTKLIDINTASAGDLNRLGERFGKAIIAGRPYRSVDELVAKRVLKRSTFSLIKDRITANSAAQPTAAPKASVVQSLPGAQSERASPRPSASNTRSNPSSRKFAAPVVQPVAEQPMVSKASEPIDINTASAADLNRLGERFGKAIIAGRPYRSVDELVSKRVLKRSTFSRIKDRITIEAVSQPSEGVKALRVRG